LSTFLAPSDVKDDDMTTKKSGGSSGGSKSTGSHRSAVTGRYVTEKHGKANPSTTVRESNKPKPSRPSKKG
jgi:hypothetical protein